MLDTQLSRSSFDRVVAGRGDHDRGYPAAAPAQLRYNIETVQIRHLVVDNQAGNVGTVPEKLRATQIGPHVEVIGFQEKTCGIAYCGIVIDDGYVRSRFIVRDAWPM